MPPSETDRHELTDNHQRAANYANDPAKPDGDGANITPVYLSIKHPFEMESDLTADEQSSLAKALTAAQGGVPNLYTSPKVSRPHSKADRAAAEALYAEKLAEWKSIGGNVGVLILAVAPEALEYRLRALRSPGRGLGCPRSRIVEFGGTD